MSYNFDTVISRKGTSAIKTDGMKECWGRDDLIPLWIADMDFATAPCVTEAIKKRLEHPILGYTAKPDSYYEAIRQWVAARYGMHIEADMIHFVSGIVPGLGLALNCFTCPGDKVMVQPPIYHPFMWLIQRNGRTLVPSPLQETDGGYAMDLDKFRHDVKGCKVFMLCNPHNPGGVVWPEEVLHDVAEICAEEGVLVFSDEIHADLTLPPRKHRPFATVSEKARMNSVTFMSPSKAFNMPGITASHAVIPNPALNERFKAHLETCEYNMGHVFAFTAVEAAYRHGAEWLDECLAYISANIDFVDGFISQHCPGIKVLRPQASFLVWLDCRGLHLSPDAVNDLFVNKAHLALNDGRMFGAHGEGDCFMRLNVGCPRSILQQALGQLEAAIKG